MPLVAWNAHILTPLFPPLWKIVNDSKGFVPAVQMTMSFKVLKYFYINKISFFLFCWLVVTRSRARKKFFFFRNLNLSTYTTVRLNKKGLLFLEKMLACCCNLPYLKVNGIKWSCSECMLNSHILEYIFKTEVTANFLCNTKHKGGNQKQFHLAKMFENLKCKLILRT